MPTSPRDERSTSNSISAGIGAGTGIAVAGLILLLTASVVSFRRRKRHHPDPGPPTPVAETSSNVPFELLQQQQLDANTRAEYLPRCFTLSLSDDSVIKHRLGGEGAMIDFHARNRYHSNNISAKPETLHASLSQLQLSEDTRRMVVNLAIDSNTRPIAIRHLLALVIFSNLDTNSVGELSLLPPVVKELFKSLPTDPPESRDSFETALLYWNRITAFIMRGNPDGTIYLKPLPSATSQIKALVTILQEFLVHFAHIDDDGSSTLQHTHLEKVITDCVEFGYDVFGQPCDWHFTFPPQEAGAVVVLPGLERHSYQFGGLYDSPKMIQPPEIVTVDSMEDQAPLSV